MVGGRNSGAPAGGYVGGKVGVEFVELRAVKDYPKLTRAPKDIWISGFFYVENEVDSPMVYLTQYGRTSNTVVKKQIFNTNNSSIVPRYPVDSQSDVMLWWFDIKLIDNAAWNATFPTVSLFMVAADSDTGTCFVDDNFGHSYWVSQQQPRVE